MAEVNGMHFGINSEAATAVGKSDCFHSGDPTQEDMTAKDYYFDSYAHFGIHEVSVLTSTLSRRLQQPS